MPIASSEHFSACALPYLKTLCAPSAAFADQRHLAAIDRATLIADGQLSPLHAWLAPSLTAAPRPPQKKRVLVLGSGLVAGPACDILAARPDVELAIATNDMAAGRRLARDRAGCVELDVGDAAQVEALVRQADVTLSLLPAPLHVQVAELCIKHRTSLVTASYTSPDMRALHERCAVLAEQDTEPTARRMLMSYCLPSSVSIRDSTICQRARSSTPLSRPAPRCVKAVCHLSERRSAASCRSAAACRRRRCRPVRSRTSSRGRRAAY